MYIVMAVFTHEDCAVFDGCLECGDLYLKVWADESMGKQRARSEL